MAKTKISEFSTTPGNNTDINGINIAEGCAPSGINNAIRELMSDLKEWQSGAMDVYVIPQGTAAAPGIQLYGDLDTGLYGFAANQLGVAVGGASAGYFSSDGWVGNVVATTVDLTNIEVTNIKAKDGTSSIALADSTGVATFSKPTVMSVDSASDALRITQIGAGNALLVEDSANPDTSPFVVTAAGLVGVGTLNPTRTIHVSAASGLPGITLESTSNGSSSSGVVVFNRTTTSTLTSQTIGSALWSHNLTDSTLVTAASIIVTGNNTAGSNTANMAIDAKTSTIMKVNGTEVANFASGGLNVTGTVDVTSIETTNIKAKDGTAAASIADSTGVMTIASSVLTTTDINGGTIDGAVIGGSSAAAGTFTTITGTQVNSDNLRLDGNTLSSTDTNGNITIAPNGTGQVVMSGDLDVANIETGAIKARDGTAGATIANSTGQFTFSANIKRGVLELGQPTGITIAMIKATNTNGSIILQANGTGSIFNYADETVLVPSGATAKLITDNGINFEIEGSQETGTFTVGGTAQTGTQTIGRSTKTHTLNLGTGATESGLTKTINLGTGGVSTSTTAINIGSANGTTTTVSGAFVANGGAVFNENGADVDFRVEGDTDANLIFADASTDRVGIGTNAPAVKLDVNGSFRVGTATSAGVTAQFGNTGNVVTFIDSGATTGNIGVVGANPMAFYTNGSERMRLDSSGNLGLGVTSPTAKLDVYATNFAGGPAIGARYNASNDRIGFNVANSNAYAYLGYNTNNAASSDTPTYDLSKAATQLRMDGGSFKFNIAASGTAGNAISFTQAMTLDASGDLLVGGTSSLGYRSQVFASTNGYTQALVQTSAFNSGNLSGTVYAGYYDGSSITDMASIRGGKENTTSGNYGGVLAFYTRPNGGSDTERARITSGGYFKASDAGTYANSTGTYHELRQTANAQAVVVSATNASYTSESISSLVTKTAGTDWLHFYGTSDANTVANIKIFGNGNIQNANGSYGTISDQKLKQDITDASSQWNDIKAIRFRKYRMKTDVAANPDAPYLIGVVAQELEQTSPNLVEETEDKIDGGTVKSVKTSVLLMKAAVALQEAMARIETLEAEVAALKGA
jgi:hypothetical protein